MRESCRVPMMRLKPGMWRFDDCCKILQASQNLVKRLNVLQRTAVLQQNRNQQKAQIHAVATRPMYGLVTDQATSGPDQVWALRLTGDLGGTLLCSIKLYQ